MKITELIDLLRTRRSIRRFKPDPIPDECIEKMIEAARWAPSGANAQPWEFIIVKDRATINRMAELYRRIHEEELQWIEQVRMEEFRHHQFAASASAQNLPAFGEAPILIVVCGDRRTLQASTLSGRYVGTEGGGGDSTYLKNMANATFSLHLAAASLGLGSQWLSVDSEWEQSLKPLLSVPSILQIHTVVPVGYPAYEPPPSYRREPEELIHINKYDLSKFRSGRRIIEYIRELRRRTKASYGR